jgi:hypothetical protein
MRNLDMSVIEYFQKNEKNIQEVIDSGQGRVTWNTLSELSSSLVLFKYNDEQGNSLEFSPIDFKRWQNNKEYYNSPLYKVMNEEG